MLGVAGVVIMRMLSRCLEWRVSGQSAILLRALVVLAIAMAITLPLLA